MECWEASCLDHAIEWAGTSGSAMSQSNCNRMNASVRELLKSEAYFLSILGCQENKGPFGWALNIQATL